MTPQRQARIRDDIAPLVVQGWSERRIAGHLGVSKSQVHQDVAKCKELWLADYQDSRDDWSGRLNAQYQWMLGELAEAWDQSKNGRITRIINPDGTELVRQEPPDPRWLSGMLAVAKEASTFLGIREGVDAVSRIEVPEATRAALQPMSQDAYQAMLATPGGLNQLNAVPPVSRRDEVEPIDVCITEQGETSATSGVGSQLPED